ncbi:Hypothetical predicted protein [Mytilus galloprovincialis]|uniref:Endonuclease/exonuclease/phosphatase domain-containing protein n=1 Tax=Mytilus galloprovincialis TaxID=29158 RepID=A0A8B6FN51_MYTGA|nr:Hypothetical predicted protein [Mytilus galloprovincialis]
MEPTHRDNILDLLLTTDPSSIEKESVQDGISDHGIVITDINLKANKMEEDLTTMPDKGPSPYESMNDIRIHEICISKLLKGLNRYKAFDPDQIPTRFLKTCAPEISPALTLLFQYSINSGTVPSDWREALITPLFKKGERNVPSNYRPVEDLTWKKHAEIAATKASRTLGLLGRNFRDCNKTVQETTYRSMVRPSLEYVSAVQSRRHKPTRQSAKKGNPLCL